MTSRWWLVGVAGIAGGAAVGFELGSPGVQLAGGVALLVSLAVGLVAVVAQGHATDPPRRVLALEPRFVGGAVAVGLLLLVLAQATKAAFYPGGHLRSTLVKGLGPAQRGALPYGDEPALRFERHGTPTQVAARVDALWPSEDQRYTPVGVFLRYERDIVAVMPLRAHTAQVLVAAAEPAFRTFRDELAGFWGPSYERSGRVARSARAVPEPADLRRLAGVLAAAERDQARPYGGPERPCYGWRIDVRSGKRAGALRGTSDGVGRAPRRSGCSVRYAVEGWVDPNAGRFTQKGDPGDYDVGIACFCVDQPTTSRLDLPPNELIEGADQQPSTTRFHPGKGLIELIEAQPLLAAETGEVPFVELAESRGRDVRLSPVIRSDRDRRAEAGDSAAGAAAAALDVLGGFWLVLTAVLVVGGLVLRATRRSSADAEV